ncbi:hypothetical protein [Nocardia thailandica]
MTTKAGRPMAVPQPVLTQIALMRHRRGMNNAAIARALEADAVPTFTGQAPWSRTRIWHLFKTAALRAIENQLRDSGMI